MCSTLMIEIFFLSSDKYAVIITKRWIAGYAKASSECHRNNDLNEKFSKETVSCKYPFTCNTTTINVAVILSTSIPNFRSLIPIYPFHFPVK